MGGKNAQIVLNDANLELALDGALWGSFGTTGQRCTATSRILLQAGIARKFTDEFVARVKKLKVGDGLDESVEVGPQVNASQIEISEKYVAIALGEGAKLLTGGHALTEGAYAHGTFFEPTVLCGVTPTMRIAREEVFGPVVSLIEFETFEEAIEIANSIDYGLSTSIYTRDVNRAFTAMRDLESGITYINAPTIGAEVHLPFGGVKHTGNGHREGNGSIDFYTTWKAVYIDYSDKLQRAQIDNAE
jgi:aldehyde dehydrogenase (NAD+)